MPIISRRRSVGLSGPGVPVATHLAFTTPPGLSGASPYTLSPQPVVAAQNAGNTTDTTYAGTATITLNVLSGSPVLSGTTTKALVSGVADFSGNALVVTGAGTWTLTATLSPLTSATSSTGTTTGAGMTGQFSDDFATNTIRTDRWGTVSSTGSGNASAATGALVLSTGASTGSVSIPEAAALPFGSLVSSPLVFKVAATSTPQLGRVILQDSAGRGFGVRFSKVAGVYYMHDGAVTAGPTFAANNFVDLSTIGSPFYVRLSRFDATHYKVEYSANADMSSPTTLASNIAVGAGADLTAMKLYVDYSDNGSGAAGSVTLDDFSWP